MSDRCQHRRGVYHFNSQAGKGKTSFNLNTTKGLQHYTAALTVCLKEDLRLKTITPIQFRSDSILNFELEHFALGGPGRT